MQCQVLYEISNQAFILYNIDNFHNIIDNIMGLIDQINTYIA